MESKKRISMYTDGSCLGNPGPGGYGVLLLYGNHRKELSGGFVRTTNNRMEIMALVIGLQSLKQSCEVCLYSDSQYLIKGIRAIPQWQSKGWRKVKNADLWRQLAVLCSKHELHIEWVAGHDLNSGNQRADKLAYEAANQQDLPIDYGYEEQLQVRQAQESLL